MKLSSKNKLDIVIVINKLLVTVFDRIEKSIYSAFLDATQRGLWF